MRCGTGICDCNLKLQRAEFTVGEGHDGNIGFKARVRGNAAPCCCKKAIHHVHECSIHTYHPCNNSSKSREMCAKKQMIVKGGTQDEVMRQEPRRVCNEVLAAFT